MREGGWGRRGSPGYENRGRDQRSAQIGIQLIGSQPVRLIDVTSQAEQATNGSPDIAVARYLV